MTTEDDTMATCANCGKGEESSGDLKACVACKMVKYCNRECQIAHRPQHKEACEKRAAELHDEALFKEHPPPEDCPICFLPLPLDTSESVFQACCGKNICLGCIYAMRVEARGRGKVNLCAFCRTPATTSEGEEVKRMKKLVEADHAFASNNLAGCYARGDHGMPQDFAKANELWLRAGKLGCANSYHNLGNSYNYGRGKEVDKQKAKHYYELAAMNGYVGARYNLGWMEGQSGNHHRAKKHFLLAASAGHQLSLDKVKQGFMNGIVTRDEYANTLRANKKIQDEMQSDMRDKARDRVRVLYR